MKNKEINSQLLEALERVMVSRFEKREGHVILTVKQEDVDAAISAIHSAVENASEDYINAQA